MEGSSNRWHARRRFGRLLSLAVLAASALPATSAWADCPTTPNPPPPPSYADQQKAVHTAWASFGQQARTYPAVPHLNPVSVAKAMQAGTYSRDTFSFVIAHRGDHMEPGYAENGLSGIWRAYLSGADGVELDVKTDCTGQTLLGHDFATGRELVTPGWSPFDSFPVTDPDYTKEDGWPFRVNKGSGNGTLNLNRGLHYAATVWNKPLNDQYANRTPFSEGQITLYQGLFAVALHAPMMVWFDVKNATDLKASARDLAQVRQDLRGPTVLNQVGLKLLPGTIKEAGYNPSQYTGVPGLLYFAVIGLGDYDAMLADAPLPGNLMSAVQKYCNPDNGCIGIELAHKYQGAPTQDLLNQLQAMQNAYKVQLAGFHTVPQYDWYAMMHENLGNRVLQTSRTFPRTDGSCCFAIDDALNSSGQSMELLDRRASYNFNTRTFSTITTDDTINILRDLRNNGKRPDAVVKMLGGDSTIPSGGAVAFRDGLYAITSLKGSAPCFLTIAGGQLRCVVSDPFLGTKQRIWSVTARGGGVFQMTNLHTGQVVIGPQAGTGAISLGENATQNGTRASIQKISSSSGRIALRDSLYNWITVTSDGSLQTVTDGTRAANFTLHRVQQQLMEQELAPGQVENRFGPMGSVFACDEGATGCNVLHQTKVRERLYYGVNDNWVTRDLASNVNASFDCTSAWFGRDPAPGQVKACFRSPVHQNAATPDGYDKSLAMDGESLRGFKGSIAYGAINPKDGLWYGMYFPGSLAKDICTTPAGTADPLFGVRKTCWARSSDPQPPAELPGFAQCGGDCTFTSPHVVALLYTGTGGVRRITYKTFTSGARCSAADFGVQAFKQPVQCLARPVLSTARTVPNFSWCADQGDTCVVTMGATAYLDRMIAAYVPVDAGAPIVYKQITGNFTCSPTAFGIHDPEPFGTCHYRLY